MKTLKKSILSLLFVTAGLHAAAGSLQQNLQVAAEQKTVALQMIEAMQGSVNFYQQAQQPLDAAGIKQQQSAWQSSLGLYHRYINDLRGQSKVARPALANLQNLPNIDALMLQSNQSKALFTRLLDEYIAHLGNVYEKKSNLLRFYRNVYVISSSDDQNLSITPNEYLALVQTLENAAQQSDWGTTINLTLPIIQADGSIVEKNLTLNEIKAAIKEIPLPASYYATALKIAAAVAVGVAAGAALSYGTGYTVGFVQGYYNPEAFESLQRKATQIEANLDGAPAVNQAQPVEQNVVANTASVTPTAQPSAPARVEALDGQPAQTSMWDYLMGRGSGYNADTETIDSDSFKDSDWYKEAEEAKKEFKPRNLNNVNEKPDIYQRLSQERDQKQLKEKAMEEIRSKQRDADNQAQSAVQPNADSSIMNFNVGSSDSAEATIDNAPVITETPVKAAAGSFQPGPNYDTALQDNSIASLFQKAPAVAAINQPAPDIININYNPSHQRTETSLNSKNNSARKNQAQAEARNKKRFGN